MDTLYQIGIQINLFFQGLGAWLKTPMDLFSFLGREEFYLLLIPAIYWCWNTSLGIQTTILLMVSAGLNTVFKIMLHQPRPYWYDPTVKALAVEISFGIPSGHAQNAVVIWAGIASWIKKIWAWIAAIIIILLISISRIYLGVHFPTDILAGWAIGALILIVYVLLEKPVKKWMDSQSSGIQILTVFLGSLLLILTGILARSLVGDYTFPQAWLQNIHHWFPNSQPDPLALSTIYSSAGVLFGACLGAILLKPRGGFNPGGVWWQRLTRYVLGLAIMVLLYLGLDLIMPGGQDIIGNFFRYLRYGVVGLWVSWGAPLTFYALKLARPLK